MRIEPFEDILRERNRDLRHNVLKRQAHKVQWARGHMELVLHQFQFSLDPILSIHRALIHLVQCLRALVENI